MKTIIDIIFTILEQVFVLFTDLIIALFRGTPKRKTMYNADFLKEKEILSNSNHGFCLTGKRNLTIQGSYMHSLILGGSGSGKTSSVLLPTIYNMVKGGHSIIVHDPSGELYTNSASYLQSFNYAVKVLHYADTDVSDGYNPLQRVHTQSDINKIATVIVKNSLGAGSGNDSFWNSQTISLISLIICILKKQEPQFQNLGNAKYLIDQFQINHDFMDRLVAQTKDEYIIREYKSFLKYDSKVISNIVSTCRSALLLFSDATVQKVTAFDTIDFDSFRKEKTVLFIQNKTSEIKYYSVLSSIFFEQFFASIMDKIPTKDDKSLFFLLDEASSLYLPTLQIALANLRKYRAGIMLVAQDFNQLIHVYGHNDGEAIRTNCYAKVYFPGQPLDTCRELEALLGKYEFEDEQNRYKIRSLLTADEIRTMPRNTALLFCGSHRAIYAQMHPFYEQKHLREYRNLPPPTPISKIPFEEIPLVEPKLDKKPE